MKTYVGERIDGECEVYVHEDGKQYPLPLHLEIRNQSPTGFDWGYGGSGPAQLALAIMADHFGPGHPPEKCPFCNSKMDGTHCSEWRECAYDYSKEDAWNHIQSRPTHYQEFKEKFISCITADKWTLTTEIIDNWVAFQIMQHKAHDEV